MRRGYPHTPGFRKSARAASKRAATSMEPAAPNLRERVFAAIKERPRTLWELTEDLGLLHQTASARITELQHEGRIVSDGERPTPTGRPANVWKAVDPADIVHPPMPRRESQVVETVTKRPPVRVEAGPDQPIALIGDVIWEALRKRADKDHLLHVSFSGGRHLQRNPEGVILSDWTLPIIRSVNGGKLPWES